MKTVSIHDAKTNLSKYIAAAKNGQKIYIGSYGKPEVVLTQLNHQDKGESNHRNFSQATDLVKEHDDSFSTQTDKQIEDMLTQGQ